MKSYYETNRKSDIMTLSEAIEALLQAYRLKDRYQNAGVVVSWEKLMGETISRYTKRVFIKNKMLYVEIMSAPLKNELMMSKKQIIKLLNQEAGVELVSEVIFL